jgi:hypothetical protein
MKHILFILFLAISSKGIGQSMPNINDYLTTGCKLDPGFDTAMCNRQEKAYREALDKWLHDIVREHTEYFPSINTSGVTNTGIIDTGKFGYSMAEFYGIKDSVIMDTIPCIMLVSDTALTTYHVNAYYSIPATDVICWNQNAFYVRGYEIRKHFWPYHPDYAIIDEEMSVETIGYLNGNYIAVGTGGNLQSLLSWF